MINALRSYVGPLLALTFIIVQLVDVKSYPLFLYDEALLNDAGWQLVFAGQFRADVLSLRKGFETRYLWQPPGLALSAALSYALFGFGIVQTRLPSIVFGGLAVWAIYRLVEVTSGQRSSAFIAAALLFTWPAWVVTAKTSRMDTGAILALLIATTGVIRSLQGNDGKPSGLFVCGIAGGVGALFHTAALPWCFGLLCVTLIFSRWRLVPVAAYSIGTTVPIALWLTYGLMTPRDFELQYLTLLMDRTHVGGTMFGRIEAEGERYVQEFARIPTILPALAVAIYGYLRHRLWKEHKVVMVLALTALVVLLHAFVAGKKSGFYTLFPVTLLLCVIAIGIGAVISPNCRSSQWRSAAIGAALSVGLLLGNTVLFSLGPRAVAFWKQGPQRDYARQMAPLGEILKPGDRVWGDPVAWLTVIEAGAKLDASSWVPGSPTPEPDPHYHKYVVVPRGAGFNRIGDYRKVREFGEYLPPTFGRLLTDKSYSFDLWQSKYLD